MTTEYIVQLRHSDLPQLRDLLTANHLPDDDCAEQIEGICGIFDGDTLVAAGGLEFLGDNALLRSVVVHHAYRNQGFAHRLTMHLLQQAEIQEVSVVYLLTETAADYFKNLGFQPIARERVPAEVQATRQFSSLCPDSAACLCIGLPLMSMAPA